MRIVSASARVHNLYPLRLASVNLQILQAHSPEECPALLLKPVLVIPPTPVFSSLCFVAATSAPHAGCHIRLHQNRQVRLQIAAYNALQRQDWLAAPYAAAAKPFEAYEPPLA